MHVNFNIVLNKNDMANIKSILREIVVILDSIRRKRENNRLRGKGIKKRSPMFRYIRKLISKEKIYKTLN